jgi:N-acetylmuramic acid 6-phosphate etherase
MPGSQKTPGLAPGPSRGDREGHGEKMGPRETTQMKKPTQSKTSPTCLGIEAGATRTVAMATGPGLPSPVRQEFGPANLYLLDERQLARHLRTIARAMPRPDSICIGMAGARTEADRSRVRAAAARVWPEVPCHATSDLETALMAAEDVVPAKGGRTGRHERGVTPRVLVVSGTGSCCLGRSADGRTVRLGGWGHILGDKGSGYDIARRALRAVVHAGDRTGSWPPLGQRLLGSLLLNEPEDLVPWAQGASKADIAAVALEVFRAWNEGDPIARDVLGSVAHGLAEDAAACARLVTRTGTMVQFVLAGSVLLKQPRFAARVQRAIRRAWPRAVVTPLEAESAWGAVELARRQLGAAAAGRRAPLPPADALTTPSVQSLRQSPTEQRNPRSMNLDRLSLAEAVALMLTEDARVPPALLAQRRNIERAVALVARAFKHGGRLFYVGAGTSGRLGVLDASECPPTFGTSPAMVQGIMAGGPAALWSAVEGVEDDAGAGGRAVAFRGVSARDAVVGIAASGRTPFVWGALREARRRGAATVLLCFNPHVEIPRDERPVIVIAADVGPEILTGSTRLKAGTATKLVLNVLSTLAMVRLGKVKSNLMIDVKASNAKLRDRAVRILEDLTGTNEETARAALEASRWRIGPACVRIRRTEPTAGRRQPVRGRHSTALPRRRSP